jgi:hypothetical protein
MSSVIDIRGILSTLSYNRDPRVARCLIDTTSYESGYLKNFLLFFLSLLGLYVS